MICKKMKQKGISSRKILFLNISDKTWFSMVNPKILPFKKKTQMLIPKTAMLDFSSKSEKNEDTYLMFCKKIIQNRIQSVKSILFNNFA